ncbi:MAG: NUDIX hydrolase [Candidatus Hydrogenedentota bacterium]
MPTRPEPVCGTAAALDAGTPANVLRPRIRVAAIIVQDDSILLVRHVKDGKSYWLLPGGGLDYGESLAEGLVRELLEETNLEVRVGDLVIVNDSINPDGTRHVVNLCFTAEIVSGAMQCGTDHRLEEVRFVPVSEIRDLTFYPDIRDELIPAIEQGFPRRAAYLGNLWRDH